MYDYINKMIKQYMCNISHWIIRKNPKKGTSLLRLSDSYLGAKFKTGTLRIKLFQSGLKQKQCEICKITDWDGNELSFTLDHINGIKTDNRFENIRILCFICHARTETYKGKNISKEKRGLSIPYQRVKAGRPSYHLDKR